MIANVLPESLPLVSIVTAVRNGMPFVRDTVKSVLSQDYPAIEYWVIDGASGDGTVDFIKSAEASLAGWIYFDRYGKFDQSFNIAMDYELMLRGLPKVGATRVPVLVTNVRTGGISTCDPMRVIEENIRALRKNGYGVSNSRALWIRTVTRVRGVVRRLLEAVGIYRLIHRMLLE